MFLLTCMLSKFHWRNIKKIDDVAYTKLQWLLCVPPGNTQDKMHIVLKPMQLYLITTEKRIRGQCTHEQWYPITRT